MAVSFVRSKPSFEGAALGKNPRDVLAVFNYFHDRLTDVEKKTGGASVNLATSLPSATPPDPAQIQVQTQPGRFIIQLTPVNNRANAPVTHILDFSDSPSFSKTKSIPVGTQNYIEIGQFGVGISKYVGVRSSLDNTTFSTRRSAGLHTT